MTFKELHKKCRNAICVDFDKAIPLGYCLVSFQKEYPK